MTASPFRLSSVLRLRESVRDERRLALAEVLAADAALEERLQAVRRELAAARIDHQHTSLAGAIDLDRLRDADRYEAQLRAEDSWIAGQREQLAPEIEKRRTAVVVADADVRAFERLRETSLTRHRDEELRHEGKHLDEVASRQNRSAEPA